MTADNFLSLMQMYGSTAAIHAQGEQQAAFLPQSTPGLFPTTLDQQALKEVQFKDFYSDLAQDLVLSFNSLCHYNPVATQLKAN